MPDIPDFKKVSYEPFNAPDCCFEQGPSRESVERLARKMFAEGLRMGYDKAVPFIEYR